MSEVTRYDLCEFGSGLVVREGGFVVGSEDYDAALAREAALREDLSLIIKSFDELAASVGLSEARLDQTGDSPVDCANQLQQRLTVAEQRAGELEAALKFYADGDHLLLADADAWDTCSGEPINFLHDEAGTASVEDGSIAKAALSSPDGAKAWMSEADHRVNDLEELLNDAASTMGMIAENTDDGDSAEICREYVKRINEAFKPTEEGEGS